MGFFSLTMMRIALELARENPIYQDLATKFFEHYLAIATAMSQGFDGRGLWDDADGFFYDVLHPSDGSMVPLKVRSLVGLMPLMAVEVLDADLVDSIGRFSRACHFRNLWAGTVLPILLCEIQHTQPASDRRFHQRYCTIFMRCSAYFSWYNPNAQ